MEQGGHCQTFAARGLTCQKYPDHAFGAPASPSAGQLLLVTVMRRSVMTFCARRFAFDLAKRPVTGPLVQ